MKLYLNFVQYNKVQLCTVQYSTVQYSTVQYSTVPYSYPYHTCVSPTLCTTSPSQIEIQFHR